MSVLTERSPAFRHAIGDDGVLVVTMDVPGESVNTLEPRAHGRVRGVRHRPRGSARA